MIHAFSDGANTINQQTHGDGQTAYAYSFGRLVGPHTENLGEFMSLKQCNKEKHSFKIHQPEMIRAAFTLRAQATEYFWCCIRAASTGV